jgi:hypothetical protein
MTDLAERTAPAPPISPPPVRRPEIARAVSLRRSLIRLAAVATLVATAMSPPAPSR